MPNSPPRYRAAAKGNAQYINPDSRDDRPSPHARGYGRAWERLRRVALIRDDFICRLCNGAAGKSAHVDHIKPKSHGGQDELENLQTLCASCHSRKTKQEGNPLKS